MKRSEKLPRLASALLKVVDAKSTKIKRYELKRVIMFSLQIRDPHITNTWVETLLFQKLISLKNPLEESKKPYRNTLYLINVKECAMIE